MSVTTTSAPQQQIAMPAVDLRQYVGSLISSEGIRTTGDLLVSQRGAGANMSVDVAAGSCVIKDDHGAGGGFYGYTLSATQNVAITAAHATLPRVDRIVAVINDQALGDASNTIEVKVVTGTATAGATLANCTGAASVPSSALLLANVLVDALATSIVTAKIDTTGASNNSPAVRPTVTLAGTIAQTVTLITSQTLGTVQASFDTNTLLGGNIPSSYNHLRIVALLRGDTAATNVAALLRLNADTGANYDTQALYANTSTATATEALAATSITPCPGVPAASASANLFASLTVDIPVYGGTSAQKTVETRAAIKRGTASGDLFSAAYAGFWRSTAAITRASIAPASGNWAVGSAFYLYGIL